MRKVASILLMCWLSISAYTQNLVPNGSFENYSSCPSNWGELFMAEPWFQPCIYGNNSPNSVSSTDLYNSCASSQFGIPNNVGGTQLARTGIGYAGFVAYHKNWNYNWEYLEIQLSEPLVKGKKYCVEFYVSLADVSRIGVSTIGAYFSTDSVLDSTWFEPLSFYTPQIESPTMTYLIDKSNWMLVSGSLIANGGERFLTIGNFRDSVTTDIQNLNAGTDYDNAYYYIDDVSVVCCDSSGCLPTPLIIPNVFTPNGDGINDVFTFEAGHLQNYSCTIFNRWGIEVAELRDGNNSWDGRTISGLEASEGVYYYVISASYEDGKEFTRKGFLHLLR